MGRRVELSIPCEELMYDQSALRYAPGSHAYHMCVICELPYRKTHTIHAILMLLSVAVVGCSLSVTQTPTVSFHGAQAGESASATLHP